MAAADLETKIKNAIYSYEECKSLIFSTTNKGITSILVTDYCILFYIFYNIN